MESYYNAYDLRYRQVHAQNLQWSSDEPTPIVAQTLGRYPLPSGANLLEIGCGEGRDAFPLLRQRHHLLAVDVSEEAVTYCRNKSPEFAGNFQVMDCVAGQLEERFDFIYSVAVLHMLVEDSDRNGFYRFIREHLNPGGLALICTMGDGILERRTDPQTAFKSQERIHTQTGHAVCIAATSCRMVSFETFRAELAESGFTIVEEGFTAVDPDFSQMMYVVVRA